MPSVTYTDLQEPTINASWLNEVDAVTHNLDGTAVRSSLFDSRYYGPTNGPYNTIYEQKGTVHKILLDARYPNTSLSISDASGTGTGGLYADWYNNSGSMRWGVETSVGGTLCTGSTAYSTFFGSRGSHPVHFIISGQAEVSISPNGIPYGRQIHNNPSGVFTGATNQYVCSGTYIPSVTNVTNVSASTAANCNWSRTGNIVTVTGAITGITCTAAAPTASQIDVALPIASNLVGSNLHGSGTIYWNSVPVSAPVLIVTDTTNDCANLLFLAQSTSSTSFRTLTFCFSYEVLA
jgi:hypothetical protein